MMTCLALIEGCPDCAAEQEYKDKIGHRCDVSTGHFVTLCEVGGASRRVDEKYHRLSHETERCKTCGEPIWNTLGLNGFGTRPCPSGQCVEFFCLSCEVKDSSSGPIDCPTCGSCGRRPAVVRMRSLYRVKRNHW